MSSLHELDLRVFLAHPNRAVAGDLRNLDARPAHFLPPTDVGTAETLRSKTGEIAALGTGGPFLALVERRNDRRAGARSTAIRQRQSDAVRPDEHPGRCGSEPISTFAFPYPLTGPSGR